MFKIQVEPRAQAACSSNWDSFLLMTAIVIFDFRWGQAPTTPSLAIIM